MDYESSQMVGLFYFVGFTRYLIMLRTWVRGNPESVAKRISRTPAIFRGKRNNGFPPDFLRNQLCDERCIIWIIFSITSEATEWFATVGWDPWSHWRLHRGSFAKPPQKTTIYKGCPVCPGEFSAKMWNWLKLTIPLLSHRTHSTFTTKLSTSNCVLTQW